MYIYSNIQKPHWISKVLDFIGKYVVSYVDFTLYASVHSGSLNIKHNFRDKLIKFFIVN